MFVALAAFLEPERDLLGVVVQLREVRNRFLGLVRLLRDFGRFRFPLGRRFADSANKKSIFSFGLFS